MKTLSIESGAIVVVDLDPSRGGEKKKTRPCVVLEGSFSKINLCIILPITDDNGSHLSSIFVPIPVHHKTGLSKPSCIDTYQIRAVAKERIIKILGNISKETLYLVKKNLVKIIQIDEEHLEI